MPGSGTRSQLPPNHLDEAPVGDPPESLAPEFPQPPPAERNALVAGAPFEPAGLQAALLADLDRHDAADVDQRRGLADAFHRRLESLPRDGGRPVADALLQLLESGRLGEVVDSEGRTARAVAADALVGLGYPYALELSPDDLDHLRQGGGYRTPRARVVTALTLVGALSALEAIAVSNLDGALAPIHAGLTVASAIAVAATRPLTRARKWAVISLLVAGVEGVMLAAFGTPAALLSGLAAVIAAALMSKKR